MADPDDIISASLSKSQFQRFCLPKVDTGINESRKFRVIIASTGPNDVSQVQELFLRLSKNSRIETSVIIDEFLLEHDFPKDTTVLRNLYFRKFEFRDKACEVVELAEIELARQRAYELCQWADLMILAPIDYDNLAKMLCGITDCFLLEILRGWNISKSILLAPGMTISMWENPMTKKQLKKVQRIMQKVQIISPILWTYDEKSPSKKLLPWNGMNEFIEIVESQVLSALMKIVNDTDILATSTPTSFRIFTKSKASLPAEIWSLIFERVGDWEISKALDIYTSIPTPMEWQFKADMQKNEMDHYMRSLEKTILTSSIKKIKQKLQEMPENTKWLSKLSVNLIIKFGLLEILSFLEKNYKSIFLTSFGQRVLPTKASAIYGRIEVLEWWKMSPTLLSKDYNSEAIDGASKMGFIHVLEWWRRSNLSLKYTETALEQASSRGNISVLEWWKHANTQQDFCHTLECEIPSREKKDSAYAYGSVEVQRTLPLLPGKSLLTAAQNNQPLVLRWWDNSRIPVSHSEAVARVASEHGYVDVLDTWLELKGEKLSFDSKILIGPTKNGHVNALQWWKNFSRGIDGRPGRKVEYKTCDIEEALEDCIRNEKIASEVRIWWTQNGLNLGLQAREWTRTKVL